MGLLDRLKLFWKARKVMQAFKDATAAGWDWTKTAKKAGRLFLFTLLLPALYAAVEQVLEALAQVAVVAGLLESAGVPSGLTAVVAALIAGAAKWGLNFWTNRFGPKLPSGALVVDVAPEHLTK